MKRLVVYNNGRVLDYKFLQNGRELKYKNVNLVNIIDSLGISSIKNVKQDGNNITFRADDIDVLIENYNVLKNYPLFNTLNVRVNRSYRTEMLKKKKLDRLKVTSFSIVLSMSAIASSMFLMKNTKQNNIKGIYDKTDKLSISSIFDGDDIFIFDNNIENSIENDIENIKEEKNVSLIDKDTCTNEALNNIKYEGYFNISYGDRIDTDKYKYCSSNFGDLIAKYSKMYGVDEEIMLALATQENGYNTQTDNLSAAGLMQLEKSVWLGNTITAFNYETANIDSITFDKNNINDLDTNIKGACMIYKSCMKYMNNNPILATLCYNMGYGNVSYIVSKYAKECNISYDDVLNNYTDLGWQKYIKFINVGDKNYIDHVFSYKKSPDIKITDDNGNVKVYLLDNNDLHLARG